MSNKINITKDELYELYVLKNMSLKELSNKFGISESTVQRKLTENGIKKGKKLWLEKVKENNLKKYGVENISQLKEIKEKKKQKALDKYGVENISQAKEIKNKKQEKALQKYGVDCVLKSQEVKEKIRKTCLEKYGTENISKVEEINEKKKSTNLQRYGKEYPGQVKEIKEKMRQTNIQKYGVPYASMNENVKKKIRNTNKIKYGKESALQCEEVKEKIKKTCLEKYGVFYNCMREECRKNSKGAISKINKNISNLLEKNNIKNELEFNIKKFSYDIKILNSRILIEINPTYTHNSTNSNWFGSFNKPALEKDYHYNKTLYAKNNGYRCINIFDWDNVEKIINLLKNKESIQARLCNIKEISLQETSDFLNKYHLQNNCKGQDIRLGLYYKDKLIQIMTFGVPRYNKNYQYELLRLCTISDCAIIGGTEKLFKYFIKKYNPKSIISYCDNSKFSGNVYKKLGFELLDYGKPSKHWYNMKTKKHITDNLLRQRGFDQLFNTNYGKGTSNEQLMLENGFVEVYDCGQSTYIYN